MKLLVLTKGSAIYYGTKKGQNGKWLVLKNTTWVRNNNKKNINYSVHWVRKNHIKNTIETDIDINDYTHKKLEEMLKCV